MNDTSRKCHPAKGPKPIQALKKENGSKTPKTPKAPKASSHCPYSARCGICTLGHLPYAEQLQHKQQMIEKLLGKLCPVEPILGMADPTHYRSKVHAVIGTDRDKRPVSGVYALGTHYVVPVRGCLIEDERADRIIQTIVSMIPRYKLRIYNENTHRGFLRHVLVRTGHVTGQILVVLVTTAAEFPGGKAFVTELVEKHPEITSVVLNINQKETSMVLGTKDVVLHGTGYMEDEICGKRFRISPQSFYQVNARQTEVLYRTAIEYAGLTGKETLLDAYCGTGTIGLCASDHVKQLIGVELNANAVRDAKENARLNRVANAKFVCDDAGRFMVKMAREGLPLDVLIMDPPRSGSDEKFLSSVLTLKPRTVVYVSCGPESLARDAAYLVKGGYRAVKAVPVDMFPYTEHVETVVLLSRKDVYERIKFDVNVEDLQGRASSTATYSEIKAYILEKYGLKVSSLYIAQIKDKCGFEKRDNYNIGEGKNKELICPPEKEQAIMDAFRHFGMIRD